MHLNATSNAASPNQLEYLGWSCHSPGRAGWRESSSAAWLSSPGTWTARSDIRCFWLQRRRWRASCDMRRERRPPWWLMYTTVAVLSVRTSTCFSCSSVLKRRRASQTASNSRQLICHCSWGPVQSPTAACPLHMAPQPVVEASVDTTTCWILALGELLPEEKQGPTMGWRCGGRTGWLTPGTCRGTMPISGPGREANAEAVSYEAIWVAWQWLRMPYAPGASESVSVEPPSCTAGSSALTEHALLRGVLWGWLESNSMPRKEILCIGESLLFSQLTWSPNQLRWLSTVSLCSHNSARDWASMSQSSR